jgi:DNA topoisomerase-1
MTRRVPPPGAAGDPPDLRAPWSSPPAAGVVEVPVLPSASPAAGRVVVVVESPTRALALRRVVPPAIRVLATAGAILERRGNPRRGAGRVLQELTAAGRWADRILIATDPDREGEAIAADLLRQLGPAFPGRVARVHLDEDTAAGVARALSSRGTVDRGRLAARTLRDELDRKFLAAAGRVLGEDGPCGRVQAAALARVVERSGEAPSRWEVEVGLDLPEGRVRARLAPALPDPDAADAVARAVAGTAVDPAAIRRRRVEEPPPPPFDTAALLADADRLGLGPERVLDAARTLHRGVELEDGIAPLLSYPRTDETTATPAPDRPLVHGAIRPVSAEWPPERAAPFLGAAERKVYERVWRRTAAARAGPAVLEAIEVDVAAAGAAFVARAERVIDPGWRALEAPGRPGGAAAARPDAIDRRGPGSYGGERRPGATPRVGRARVVGCPGNEPFRPGELIADLAARGIGRPSTWATIARGLREAGLVRGEGGRLRATDRGRGVDRALREALGPGPAPAAVEEALRAVEAGRMAAAEFRRRFVAPLDEVARGPRGPRCSRCGRPLAAGGRCTGFPVCRGEA